jgi:hypothetical protein
MLVQGMGTNHFGQDSYAGVHRRGLHGGALVNRFTAGGSAEKEAVVATRQAVSGLVPQPEQACKYIHGHFSPEKWA